MRYSSMHGIEMKTPPAGGVSLSGFISLFMSCQQFAGPDGVGFGISTIAAHPGLKTGVDRILLPDEWTRLGRWLLEANVGGASAFLCMRVYLEPGDHAGGCAFGTFAVFHS